MSLDTNFTAITPSQYVLSHRELAKFTLTFFLRNRDGSVHFSFWGMNVKGAPDMASSVWRRHWRMRSLDGPHVNIDWRNFLTDGP